MSETEQPAALPAWGRRVYAGALLLAGGVALVALLGWFTGLPRLADYGAGQVPMAPNTALCLMLLAAAAFAAERSRGRRAAIAAALAASLLCATRAVEFLARVDLGVDRWFFHFHAGSIGLAPVGRMALFTALSLAAASVAVLLLAWPRNRRWSGAAAGVLGAAVALEGVAFTIGYLHNGPLDRDAEGIPISLPTAVALTGLGTALALRAAVAAADAQRRLELATHRSEELFRTVFHAAPLGIATLAPDGRIHEANAALGRLLGSRDLRGEPLQALLGEEGTRVLAPALASLAAGTAEGLDAELALPGSAGGEARFGHLHLHPAGRTESGGTPAHLLVMLRDTTAEQKARAFLEDANRLLEDRVRVRTRELELRNRELQDFAYVASHDLQEPLRKVQAFGDGLAERWAEQLGEEGRDYLRRMREAAGRMRRLIDDLLSFSRVTSRGRPFLPTELDQPLREALADLELRVEESGARIEVEPLPQIDADAAQMRQLFQNLVGNALKYHRPGETPRIRVWAEAATGDEVADLFDGKRVRLLVQDDGIGFDERYLDRIFTPFQRLHGRGEYEGTGIGLALCRRIAERHGGIITARSAPGSGATFVVTLPVRHGGEEGRA